MLNIHLVEDVSFCGVDVQHGAYFALAVDARQDDVRLCIPLTGDVAWHRADVILQLDFGFPGTFSADAVVEIDRHTAMRTLVGANLQRPIVDTPIKADPVEMVEPLVQLARDGGHHRDKIGFALDESFHRSQGVLVD